MAQPIQTPQVIGMPRGAAEAEVDQRQAGPDADDSFEIDIHDEGLFPLTIVWSEFCVHRDLCSTLIITAMSAVGTAVLLIFVFTMLIEGTAVECGAAAEAQADPYLRWAVAYLLAVRFTREFFLQGAFILFLGSSCEIRIVGWVFFLGWYVIIIMASVVFVMSADNNSDLLLNCLAMTFVLDIVPEQTTEFVPKKLRVSRESKEALDDFTRSVEEPTYRESWMKIIIVAILTFSVHRYATRSFWHEFFYGGWCGS